MTPTDPHFHDDSAMDVYIHTFAGRTDLYVENGAGVKREPLTPDVIREAVIHGYAVSAYLGAGDGTTHVGAIDFDLDNGEELAIQTSELLRQHEVWNLLLRSRRGAHIWVVSYGWVAAPTMRKALTAAVALACGDSVAQDPKVEVFPKAGDDLAVGALRLPGLPHQKTQQVYPILHSGIEIEPTLDSLTSVMPVNPADIRKLAGKNPLPAPYPKDLGPFYGYKEPRRWGDDPNASDILREWGIENAKPGATFRCPKHSDKRRSLTVFKDDKRVFCGSPSCALNNQGHGVGSVHLSRMEH